MQEINEKWGNYTVIILASASPRRRELLALAGFDFAVRPSGADETVPDGISPRDAAALTSSRKAEAAAALCSPGDIIVAADTVVSLGDTAMGKPRDAADATAMLAALSGRTHSVYTGYCLAKGDVRLTGCEETEVTFRTLTDAEIREYVATGEPMDKAGAYGIQGRACVFVSRIDGDYFNVVGLPVCRISELLRKLEKGEI